MVVISEDDIGGDVAIIYDVDYDKHKYLSFV